MAEQEMENRISSETAKTPEETGFSIKLMHSLCFGRCKSCFSSSENCKLNDSSQKKYDSSRESVCVKREIGLGSSIAITLGIIIGAGIFVSPKGVLNYTGSVGMALTIWTATGLISMIGAMCYAELGTSIPFSGSNYSYLMKSFGELPAFLYMWSQMVIFTPVYTVILSLTFANYILESFFPQCVFPSGAVRLLAALPICFLTYVNCRKVQWATRVQGVLTSTKILALIIIIIAGAYHLYLGNTRNFENAFEGTTTKPGFYALAFYHGIYAFGGWDCITFITEELKDPTKNLPRTIFGSLALVTVIYIMANVAYFAVLTPYEMLASNAVAVTFGERMLGPLSWTMSFFVAMSTFGALNSKILKSSRVFFVAAREGHLPDFLAMINLNYLTPVPSIVFVCMLSLAYLSTTELNFLIQYAGFVESVFFMLTIAGMIWLKHKEPELERPVKVSILFPLTYFVISGFLVVFPIYVNPRGPLIGASIAALGVPVYAITVFWKDKPKFYSKAIGALTSFMQKMFMSIAEEKQD
ncbi:Y+L amino acid transporter 2-like [Argiope bruennichi]|uniref:Y+L amino acid transporter 2-like n=1 Tax=Argiope bruennichi TaxID=94029 RepID=UPI00249514BC|nr:Y+L amino acid transporter 2-like [Argiope bruennichi]